jgi:HEAT repeat protein
MLVPSLGPPDVARCKAKGDIAGLKKGLTYTRDWRVRAAAAEALAEVGAAEALEALIEALADENWAVRKAAGLAIRQMRDARALEPFIAALSGQTQEARQLAAEALGQLYDARAVEPLVGALADRSWDVRAAAARSLGVIADARAVSPLMVSMRESDLGVRDAAADALVRIGPPAFDALVGALDDPSWDVRRTAALALGRLGDQRATGRLLLALRDNSDPWLRQDAALALGQIGDLSAISLLRDALFDDAPRVREAAAEALHALESISTQAADPRPAGQAASNRETSITPLERHRGPRRRTR